MDKNSGTESIKRQKRKEGGKRGRGKGSKQRRKETEDKRKNVKSTKRQREGVNDGSSCDIDPAHGSLWRELQ